MEDEKKITVRLPPELAARLEQFCAETHVDRSKTVRDALAQYLTAPSGKVSIELKTHLRFLKILLQEDVNDCGTLDSIRKEVDLLCAMLNASEFSDT